MPFFTRCGLLAALLLLCQPPIWAAPAPSDSPPVLFRAHGSFSQQPIAGRAGDYVPTLKTQPLTLPAGRYRFIVDVKPNLRGQQVESVSMTLLGPDGASILPNELHQSALGIGRVAMDVDLSAPFSGLVQYGGGNLIPQEMWFIIVSAKAPGFVPFSFGAVPKPLKKGPENAVHGTLTDDIGDYYYLSLPAGSWQIRLALTTADNSGAPDGENGKAVFGAHVELLDEQGVQKYNTTKTGGGTSSSPIWLDNVLFWNGAMEKSNEMTQVFHTDAAEYVKLHIVPFAGSVYAHIVPMKYVLTLQPAPAASPVETRGD